MITATRLFGIDAAHRVLRHESKCAHLHGHRYSFEVTVRAPELDSLGRVIDFGEVKARIGSWLDENWDHACIINSQDTELLQFLQANQQRFYAMTGNPTAENLAKVLGTVGKSLLPPNIQLTRVRCWETPNCFCDWTDE